MGSILQQDSDPQLLEPLIAWLLGWGPGPEKCSNDASICVVFCGFFFKCKAFEKGSESVAKNPFYLGNLKG